MSKHQPKTGDRVRVVLEGEVTEMLSYGEFAIGLSANANYIRPDAVHVISIEKLVEPEPAVGSVVLDKDGDAWQRVRGNWWEIAGSRSNPWTWKELNTTYAPLKVIHTP